MPELPEVETVVRQLSKVILGKQISAVEIKDSQVFDLQTKDCIGDTITAVERKGKFIVISLQSGKSLLIHLRMTGHFHFNKKDNLELAEKYNKFLTGVLRFKDGSFMTYNSIRKFGHVKVMAPEQLTNYLNSLGPEPLEIKENEFVKLLQSVPRSNIKTKLLDQKFIVGIGNIYAQEALYHAGIDPQKTIGVVSSQKLSKLHFHLQRILKIAIDMNGTTVDNFSHLDGKGNFQGMLTVYNRSKCPKNHNLTKISLGGRGTSFCNICQN